MAGTVRTADGVSIAVTHRVPAVPTGAAVVLAHGFTGSKEQAEVVALADALVADGHHVFAFDLRGHGESGGLSTLGDLERLDVAAVSHEARDHAGSIVLVGASMGAVAVLGYAAARPDIAGVVAVSSPAVWKVPRSLRGLLSVPITRTRWGQAFARRRLGVRMARRWTHPAPPAQLVERVEAPVAFVHGRRDRFVHHSASVQLHAHAAERWRIELVDDMAHAFDAAGIPSIRAAVAWILQAHETLTSAEIPDTLV
jgi:alpha-beta hydrolase superfamily lysophospholipase